MTTEQDVKQMIANDMQAINESPYPVPLPEWLMDNFDNWIMKTAQSNHPFFAKTIQNIRKKTPAELTSYEGAFVCTVWNQVVPELLTDNIEDFLRKKEILQEIMYKYNKIMANEEKKLQTKEQVLMDALPKKPKILTPKFQ